MAAIAFDTLQFVRRLTAVGVPPEQAEAQAELMAEAFVFNKDSLVTRDYLDTRLEPLYERMDQLDRRIGQLEDRGSSVEGRLAGLEHCLDHHKWVLWLLTVGVFLPQVRDLLGY